MEHVTKGFLVNDEAISNHTGGTGLTELGEAEVGGVLTEALTAHVELVLADECLLVAADHAVAGALTLLDLLAGTPLLEVAHDSL